MRVRTQAPTSGKNREEQFAGLPTASQWEKIGCQPRFGTLIQLVSLRSKRNQGVGDFEDINAFGDLLGHMGGSIIQLLPINDMGRGKTPYSSLSAFALDPLYIAIDQIPEMKEDRSDGINSYLRANWHTVDEQKASRQVDVDRIRAFKFGALYQLYRDFVDRNRPWNSERWRGFLSYVANNRYWLEDYATFRSLKNTLGWTSWNDWPEPYRYRHHDAISQYRRDHADEIQFFKYVQWMAYTQMVDAHNRCRKDGMHLKGDLPLLVDYESSDVWAHPQYFNRDVCAGAPPDQYSTQGQNWGSPTYNWDNLCRDNYLWWRKRLEYASHFYDIFRIDHIVGLFRIWTYPITLEHPRGTPAGWNGYFDPEDPGGGHHKPIWESHGRNLLDMMVRSSTMLPIGEDLGTIPRACRQVMAEMGIPGYKVIIWERDWQEEGSPFFNPDEYDYISMATTTTHDFWTMAGHYEHREADEKEQESLETQKKDLWKFVMGRKKYSQEYTDDFHWSLLEKLFSSGSIFVILPFQDLWGKVPGLYGDDVNYDRINDPSNPSRDSNWSGKFPLNIEDFASHRDLASRIDKIRGMVRDTGRHKNSPVE